MSVVVCEACAGPIANPGHGRRYCERCSPPSAIRARTCSHGLTVPCPSCWTVGYLKRRARKTGGRDLRPLTGARARAAHLAHLADERRELEKSELGPDQ